MSRAETHPVTLDDWIAHDAFTVAVDSAVEFDAAVDRMVGSLGDAVDLLGLGEALHGAEDVLVLRNCLFRRLVAAHGYTAIALESSFPRGRLVDDYVAGRGPASSYDDVRERGFSHGFGRSDVNRELVEWMRRYNAESPGRPGLHFYGFDSPTEMTGTDSPRQLMTFALDYVEGIDAAGGSQRRQRIAELLGNDADWESPAAMMDPARSIGLSKAANALRVEAEELVTELELRRPEVTGGDDEGHYLGALRHASAARQFLTYHAGLARASDDRLVRLLGIRDLMMAGNLAYAAERERRRGGRVLAFAHNSHLKRGRAAWQLGPHALAWWPAGAHVAATLGPRYAVIGTGVGVSEANGIGEPEAGTLEARLSAGAGRARFIPTRRGERLSTAETAALPTRSGSGKNSTFFPLSAQSLTDFDMLLILG